MITVETTSIHSIDEITKDKSIDKDTGMVRIRYNPPGHKEWFEEKGLIIDDYQYGFTGRANHSCQMVVTMAYMFEDHNLGMLFKLTFGGK